jgi:hypothetical protein
MSRSGRQSDAPTPMATWMTRGSRSVLALGLLVGLVSLVIEDPLVGAAAEGPGAAHERSYGSMRGRASRAGPAQQGRAAPYRLATMAKTQSVRVTMANVIGREPWVGSPTPNDGGTLILPLGPTCGRAFPADVAANIESRQAIVDAVRG